MSAVIRRFGMIAAIAAVGVYAVVALRGPQGIPAWMEKRREIRELQEQNATLARENQRKRDRIEQLKHDEQQKELEVRKQMKLLRKGERSFILPENAPAPPAAAKPAEPETSPAAQ